MVDVYRAAPVYDAASGEWLVYRAGREVAVAALGLREGDTVLDVGCGTGLSFPLLAEAVGPLGHIIGIDRSPDMLRVARRRANRMGIVATTLLDDMTGLRGSSRQLLGRVSPDAVLFAYALSLARPWRRAWAEIIQSLPGGARVGVLDMADPTGTAALLTPLARVACWFGGADIHAHPWQAFEEDWADVTHSTVRGGHIHVVTGTLIQQH